jgi:hypothetical protein
MDTRVAGHQARRPFNRALLVALDDGRFRIRSVHVKAAVHRHGFFVRRKKFFCPLKFFSAFLIFFASRKEVSWRRPMTMGELFTVAALASIALMMAAYWQSDDDGGLV